MMDAYFKKYIKGKTIASTSTYSPVRVLRNSTGSLTCVYALHDFLDSSATLLPYAHTSDRFQVHISLRAAGRSRKPVNYTHEAPEVLTSLAQLSSHTGPHDN